jgi:TRAP-type C4-dicarboxylate transport system substrate-binding protein
MSIFTAAKLHNSARKAHHDGLRQRPADFVVNKRHLDVLTEADRAIVRQAAIDAGRRW